MPVKGSNRRKIMFVESLLIQNDIVLEIPYFCEDIGQAPVSLKPKKARVLVLLKEIEN